MCRSGVERSSEGAIRFDSSNVRASGPSAERSVESIGLGCSRSGQVSAIATDCATVVCVPAERLRGGPGDRCDRAPAQCSAAAVELAQARFSDGKRPARRIAVAAWNVGCYGSSWVPA